MTKNEKAWLEMVANVVDQLVKKYHYSKACANLKSDDAFFNDSCNYVGLSFELDQLVRTLRGLIRFSELVEHKPEK